VFTTRSDCGERMFEEVSKRQAEVLETAELLCREHIFTSPFHLGPAFYAHDLCVHVLPNTWHSVSRCFACATPWVDEEASGI
jgi:hypothetical protein